MTTQIDYEGIARENGYKVDLFGFLGKQYYWYKESDPENVSSEFLFSNEDSCYKACCVENNLVGRGNEDS